MRIGNAMLVGAALATGAMAQPPSRQKLYEAAQAAYDQEKWQVAVDGFAPLLADEAHPGRTDGMLRARYALGLAMLGRLDEAETQAARATGEFPADAVDEERGNAWLTLGKVRESAHSLAAALDAYDRALTALPPNAQLRSEVLNDMMRAGLTVDPARSSAAASALIKSTLFADLPKDRQALVLAYQALAKLNGGDTAGSLPIVRRAVALTGGLQGERVNTIQAMVRGDASLVMMRAGRDDDARQALAFAGGGYMPSSAWLDSGETELPLCNDLVRPDDVAVVEFTVADDGTVASAVPVFASRPGQIGAFFAARVGDWRFPPTAIAGVQPFWRTAVRLELRCVTRPASLALWRPFNAAAVRWLTERRMVVSPDELEVKRPTPDAASSNAGALTDTLHRAAAARGQRPVPPQEIDAALATAGAPADVRAAFAYRAVDRRGAGPVLAGTRAAAFAALADRFAALPDGATAAAWFDVETALALETNGKFADARPRLDRAIATPVALLPDNDPIRVVATLHRALVDRQLGDATSADARLRSAGLDAEQCSMFDVHPLPLKEGASSNDFPMEALAWRMEGFAQTAFDISADGKVDRARTVRAYPPFVFGPGSEKTVSRFRYLPPTLNNVVLGCSAMTRTFRFQIPK